LVRALSELRTSIGNNRHLIPNYGQRYHKGEAVATGFVGVSHLLHMALLKKVSRLIRLMVVGASRDIMPKAAF
jgi:hypothetical protein